jgi:hypothetical protein
VNRLSQLFSGEESFMNNRILRFVLGGSLIAALASSAIAQDPGQFGGQGRGRRGGMPGGFGGPGGQGGQGGGMFGRGGPGSVGQGQNDHNPLVSHVMELIYRSDVRTEIHLTLKQRNALDQYKAQSQQAVQAKMQQMAQDLGLRNRPNRQNAAQPGDPVAQADQAAQQQQQQQVFQQFQDQRTQLQNQVNQGAFDLLTVEQAKRLHELDLQWRGILSNAEAKVAEEVQVSQEHRTSVMALVTECQAKAGDARRQAFQNMRGNRQGNAGGLSANQQNPFTAVQKADDDARKEAEEKALPILSTEEKSHWTAAQGRPFTFRKDIQTLRN